MQNFLFETVMGNTVLMYLYFLISLIVSLAIVKIFRYFILKRLQKLAEKTATDLDDLVVLGIRKYLVPTAYFAVFYVNLKTLVLSPMAEKILNFAALGFGIAMAAGLVSSLLVLSFNKYWARKNNGQNKELAIRWIGGFIRFLVWSIALILFLDNIGIKINSLIAGLGIGGVAIAFAAQSILADIFCFFTIFFDRPFEIGDFIISGEQSGTVEHIGIKTTRLRSLHGEQLVFSNTDLTSSRIHNFKTMQQRRVLFTLGVTYDTPLDQLKAIPGLVQNIIEETEGTAFDRAHFTAHAAYSLNFEIVYFVMSSDYIRYADIHQEINFRIRETFDSRGIRFAYLQAITPLPDSP